jgi:hypothetical protein
MDQKNFFFRFTFGGVDRLSFAVLEWVDADSSTVPHAAGGSVREETP